MFATPIKRSLSRPSKSSTGKNFWFVSIVAISASDGTARNAVSKLHAIAFGHSTSALTSSRMPASMRALPPPAWAALSTSWTMRARRSSGSTSTLAARNAST